MKTRAFQVQPIYTHGHSGKGL